MITIIRLTIGIVIGTILASILISCEKSEKKSIAYKKCNEQYQAMSKNFDRDTKNKILLGGDLICHDRYLK
ncbi:hypothetical protein UFOVP623_41 [uncultured Caudovirales phage]|uniref:Lipoprotein n=1 Tax=uncultured Caudovirales phage TaxID=2100421 RepID=A0A6J5NDA4_9CAUD|nr:hypothetical protein UFOVP623_41 [uncultured Caudovirales phage]